MLSVQLYYKAKHQPNFRLKHVSTIKNGCLVDTYFVIWESNEFNCLSLLTQNDNDDCLLEITKEQYEKLYKELEGKAKYVEKK